MSIDLNDDRILVNYFDCNINPLWSKEIKSNEDSLKVVLNNENIVIDGVEYIYYKTSDFNYRGIIKKDNELIPIDYYTKIYYSIEKVLGKEHIVFWDYCVTSEDSAKEFGYELEDEFTINLEQKVAEKIVLPNCLKDIVRYDNDNIVIDDDVFIFLKREKKWFLENGVVVYYKRKKDNKIFGIRGGANNSEQDVEFIFSSNRNWYLIECSKDFEI